jgi:PAS domain S-box-containing protein
MDEISQSNSPMMDAPEELSRGFDAMAVLEATSDGVFVLGRDWRFTYLNSEAVSRIGKARDLLGTSLWEVLPEMGGSALEQSCRRAMAKGVSTRCEYLHPSSSVWLEASTHPFPEGLIVYVREITDRRRHEAALQESESRFRRLADSVPVLIWMSGPDKAGVYFNKTWLDFTGRPLERELGEGWIELVHPDDVPALEACARAFAARQPFQTDFRLHRHDGEWRWMLDTGLPRFTPDGSFAGYIGSCIDITERKRAEESLARRAEEQAALYQITDRLHRAESLSDVYDSALDAILRALPCQRASILLFDESSVMKFVAWRGLSDDLRWATDGHSPWAPDARDPQPICIDDVERADIPESLQATIKAEGIGALTFIPLVSNGKLIGTFMSYYDASHVLTDADVKLAVAIGRQLGFGIERMRAEQALRESEARESARAAELRTIMDAVPAVIWIARDPTSRVITGNQASYDFLDLPRESNPSLSAAEDQRPRNFEVLVDGRVLAPEELPVQRAARGEDVRNFEEEVRFDDGTSRYLFGNATPLRDVQGNPCGSVAAFVDITDRKKAEEQRDLLVAELNHRVKNTLATVISIARQSFPRNPIIDDARRSFDARIRALAQTHNRLAEANWSGVSLEAMLLDGLAPYFREGGRNVRVSGPPMAFSAKCALTLGMAIHELATNAAKYGALSTKAGSVDVAWQVDSQNGQLRICWAEAGGPTVSAPESSGFGRLFLERALASDLGGDVELDFATGGLKCAVTIPLDEHVARVP